MSRSRVCFPEIGCHGRFGNALFQYAAGLALARHHGCEFEVHPNIFQRKHHGQRCLLGYLNIPFVFLPNGDDAAPLYTDPPELNREFNPDFFKLPARINIHGHFENEGYFDNIRDELKNIYQLNAEIKHWTQSYIAYIRAKHEPNTTIIGLHMRRGDMLVCTEAMRYIEDCSWHYRYIKAAMHQFTDLKNVVFLVFTGGARSPGCDNTSDIEWCRYALRNAFPNIKFEFSENNGCIGDFSLLTMCDHVILDCATTCGWWAAWLNQNPGSKKIVPKSIPGLYFPPTYWSREFTALDIPH